jgi:hypothetical protein
MWFAFCYKVCRARRESRLAEQAALLTTIALLAITFTISSPTVWTSIDGLVGWSNLSALLSQSSAVLTAASARVAVLFWLQPESAGPRVRRFIVLIGAVLLLMTVLFLSSPQLRERPSDFVAEYAGQPHIAGYLTVYMVAFGAVQLSVTRHCFRIAQYVNESWQDSEKFWFRAGFLVGASGCALGVVYCVLRVAGLLAVQMNVDPHRWEHHVRSVVGLGVLLIAVGFTLPNWGPRLSSLRRLPRNRRIHRDLYPLWFAFYEAFPHIAMNPPRLTPATGEPAVWDLEFRIVRMVVEILDGRLDLRPHMTEDAERFARQQALTAGLTGDELEATVEAHRIRMALFAASNGSTAANAKPSVIGTRTQSRDLPEETEWLRRVARAFSSASALSKTR